MCSESLCSDAVAARMHTAVCARLPYMQIWVLLGAQRIRMAATRAFQSMRMRVTAAAAATAAAPLRRCMATRLTARLHLQRWQQHAHSSSKDAATDFRGGQWASIATGSNWSQRRSPVSPRRVSESRTVGSSSPLTSAAPVEESSWSAASQASALHGCSLPVLVLSLLYQPALYSRSSLHSLLLPTHFLCRALGFLASS